MCEFEFIGAVCWWHGMKPGTQADWVSGAATWAAVFVALFGPSIRARCQRKAVHKSNKDLLRVILTGAEQALGGFISATSTDLLEGQYKISYEDLRSAIKRTLAATERHSGLIAQLATKDAAEVLDIETALEAVLEQIHIDLNLLARVGLMNTGHLSQVRSAFGGYQAQINKFTQAESRRTLIPKPA